MPKQILIGPPTGARLTAFDRQVQQISSRVSAQIGIHFFKSMVEHLTQALAADCAFIGEFASGQNERVKSVAAWCGNAPENFIYDLAGSAASQVALGKPCLCRAHAQQRFPHDPMLSKWNAEACIGVPLIDSREFPIGLIMAVYHSTLPDTRATKDILDIFAPRAAAELERRQQEALVRQSEQRHKAFITMNHDAMWRIEFEPPVSTTLPEHEQVENIYRDGFIAECNDALAHQLGKDNADQLIGWPVKDLASLSSPAFRSATLHAIRSGYHFTTVETAPEAVNGQHKHLLRSQWGIVDEGMLQRIWGCAKDITELKESQMALDAAEQRFAGFLQNLPLIVLMMEPDGQTSFCNDYLCRLTGWRLSDLAGKDWLDLMIPAGDRARVRSTIAAASANSARPVHFQSPLVGREGARHWIAWDCTSLLDSAGSISAIAIVGCDITEFKALEAQFHQSQKLEHIGRMTDGIARDFNNLLTVILGRASLLLEHHRTPGFSRDSAAQIVKAAEQGAALTNRLFAFSSRRVLRPETLNPAKLIADDESMIRQLVGPHIKLVTNFDCPAAFVDADAGDLHQIILNLVVNARDAMPGGGTLTISTISADPNYVQITVTDSGTGMTEEVRSHLFEPFFTTKAEGKGTGLGLSTVYGIVQQSRGHIVVETDPAIGTSFRIFLPRVHRPPAYTPSSGLAAQAPRGTETILLVEDQAEVRLLAANILRGLGYKVLEAQEPAQAREFAKGSGCDVIHLLLTGVAMAGTSGSELASTIKASCPNIKVLFMSGFAFPPSGNQKAPDASLAWLQKPFTPEALAKAVRELLDR